MFKMTDELKDRYNDEINFMNADNMFYALDSLINREGLDNILKEEYETEEEALSGYVSKSSAIRFSCDAIEHYVKAILIMIGSNWDE
jgi:hypothetical protein